MSILQSLREFVSPQVLDSVKSHEGSDTAKTGLLESLYALLASQLADKSAYDRVSGLSASELDHSDTFLAKLLGENATPSVLSPFYTTLSEKFSLPLATVTAIASKALPLAFNHIKTKAGATSVPDYLSGEREGLLSSLPSWLIAALPAGLLGATTVSTPVNPINTTQTTTQAAPVVTPTETVGVLHKQEKEGGSFMKGLLPIIGLIILGALAWLMLKSCQKDPTPVAAPVATETVQTAPAVALAPASLNLALDETGNALYACDGDVGNQGLGEQIRSSIAGVFGADVCQFEVVKNTESTLEANQYLPQILGFMKGVPNATASIVGKKILLNASDAAALEKLVADVKGALPTDFIVEAEPVLNEAEVIANSISASSAALDGLTDTSTIDELIHALNLQIINFAVDSDEIPAENKAILDKAATRLMALPDAHLVITGHTDNTASLEYNQALSERRAKSVHDYLVSKGVSDDKLETQGASYTRPIASNATEQGRFKNRRIEFTIMHNGETVANTDAGTGTATVSTTDTTTAPVVAPVADAVATAGAKTADAVESAVATTVDATKTAGEVVKEAATDTANAVTDKK